MYMYYIWVRISVAGTSHVGAHYCSVVLNYVINLAPRRMT